MKQNRELRLEAFERVLLAVKNSQKDTVNKMEGLRAAGKTNTVTFKQLMAKKLTNDNILNLFKLYDIE